MSPSKQTCLAWRSGLGGKRGIDGTTSLGYLESTSMKKIAAYKFTFLTATLILVALLLPAKTYSNFPSAPGIDKVAHFVLFFLFTFAFGEEYRRDKKTVPSLLIETTAVIPFILASELLQLLTRTRHFEAKDMVADALGAATAIAIAGLYRRLKQDKGKKQ